MGTISETVQHRMERAQQKPTKLDELTKPGWGDVSDYNYQKQIKYRMPKCKVPAAFQAELQEDSASSTRTAFGERMETLDSLPTNSQLLQETSRPWSINWGLAPQQAQAYECIPSLPPHAATVKSMITKSMRVEPLSIYPGI